ncbi:prepilin-type N-terminal cleavage/methylation domain-containing protein [Paraburkholderia sp. Ac-20340]|uniref:type IV pilin protein n=1 Tax=Paraburkholderia sp. Ac-20340 TaxID=2703888 RepID=UPI0019826BBC|nr:type IV pilin protein [Paraburkholderia sp. Ac-20340]MBN3858824.1 prepilin-type N-terminal cleavage/methylation domain-containing protein [Paraburkholderia sp. Ac-20340]
MRLKIRAFTLLEMMIALAAAAIVAAFALPGWRGQMARGHRIDAVAALYRAAQYVDAQSGASASLPAGFDQAPPSGNAVYRLKLRAGDDANGGYAIVATPTASGPMRGDPCGAFVLEANGAHSNEAIGESAPATRDCWRER